MVDCASDGCTPPYSLRNADGTTFETGAMNIGWAARPTTVDFLSSSGIRRLGLDDIVGDTMRLALGGPGASRPPSFAGAAVYSTQK